MPASRRRSSRKPWILAGILALLLHAQLILSGLLPAMYNYWNGLFPKPRTAETTEVSLVAMTRNEWDQNRSVHAKVDAKQEEKRQEASLEQEKKKEEETDLKGQVVDIPPTPDSSRPEKARFLSEHNTNVEKESVSRNQRKDYGIAQTRPTIADYSRRRSDEQQKEPGKQDIAMVTRKQGRRGTTSAEQAFAMEIPDIKKRESLRLKLDLDLGSLGRYQPSDEIHGNSERLRLKSGRMLQNEQTDGDGGKDQQTVAMFKKPSLSRLDMVSGAPANDYIRDVPKGEETMLNSREFKYATFFNRVKRGVSEHWSPGDAYVRRDPYGNIYGVKDRYTVLNVELSTAGELHGVSVAQSCGVSFLDDEAISAFQGASPFPNPPRGLADADGMIRFQFGFYFEIGERPRIQAFRSRRYPY
ncbi:MAG TPA: energy transducer TonB [Myxococcota bacterium]|nr:energy transducer TonB [Myxococcota bacterium]